MKFTVLFTFRDIRASFSKGDFDTAEDAHAWAQDFSRKYMTPARWDVVATNYSTNILE